MRVLVTGATGFIGSNVARSLVAQGYEVKALVRKGSSTLTIEDTPVERVEGDVRDRESVARAVRECQAVFHCAALYTFWSRRAQDLYDVNVGGTRTILEEAKGAGIERVVYTSTVSTIGLPKDMVGTEEMQPSPKKLVGHYKRSKYLGEKEAMRFAGQGMQVIVVNPTAPVGPWDVKPTPTGKMVLDFLLGRIPAYVETGMNLVDVEDVAQGHILALEKGHPGERYLLGNKNLTLKEVFGLLSKITGKGAPRLKLPMWLALTAGYIDDFIEGKLLRRRPVIPLEGLRVSRKPMYVNCAKAVKELGLPQSPVEGALEKAVQWFKTYGYV